jgi:hypothetical protein
VGEQLAAHCLISWPLPNNWAEKEWILYKMAAKMKRQKDIHHHGFKHTYYDNLPPS